MCYTYILYSTAIDKYYVGYTCSTIEERLLKHNANHKGFTGKAADWKVVWKRPFQNKTDAYAMERTIKVWKSRKKIEELIKQ